MRHGKQTASQMTKRVVRLLTPRKRATKISTRVAPKFVVDEVRLRSDHELFLSPRQLDAVLGMLHGRTNRDMAKERGVRAHCVSGHLAEARRYFKVPNNRLLTILLTELGYVGTYERMELKRASTHSTTILRRTSGMAEAD